jgi:type IV pilus assembly protein PilE
MDFVWAGRVVERDRSMVGSQLLRTMKSRSRLGGFTLVELMVVVAIVGIIGSFAVPSLQNYVMRSRRTEAYINLAGLYTAQKVYHMEHDEYGMTFADIGFEISGANVIDPTTLQSKFYTYTLETFAIDGVANANYSAVATGDIDPGDEMLDIIMVEGGLVVLD